MKLLDPNAASILSSSSLLTGESVFTSVLFYQNKFLHLENHLERLIKGAKYFFPEIELDFDQIKTLITKHLTEKIENNSNVKAFRITIVKEGFFITPRDWNESDFNIKLGRSSAVRGINFKPSYLKISNYGLEFFELKQSIYDDLIYFDLNGYLTEATTSNVFFIDQQNRICTPKLNSNILDGVLRRKLLNFCIKNELTWVETEINEKMIVEANCMFLTNAIKGIRNVTNFENKSFSNCESFEKILDSFGRYGEKFYE